MKSARLDLDELKKDKNLLLEELGVESAGNNCKCPFHSDKHGSLLIRCDQSSKNWLWECQAGCGKGSLIDARMMRENLDFRGAIKSLGKDLGLSIHAIAPKPLPPKINLSRAERLVKDAHENLLNSFELFERWSVEKRGIVHLETIKRLRLGFMEGLQLYGWKSKITGWIIPVLDLKGNIECVKIHNEVRTDPTIPKCFWAPLGLGDKEERRNGYPTLYPNPEMFGEVDVYYYCPGELKAIALIDAGFAAGSPTSGEGKKAIHRDDVARIKAKRICVIYDGEEDKKKPNGTYFNAGDEWRNVNQAEFIKAGFECEAITFRDAEEIFRELKKNEQKTAEEDAKEARREKATDSKPNDRNNFSAFQVPADIFDGEVIALDPAGLEKLFAEFERTGEAPKPPPGRTPGYYRRWNALFSNSLYVKPNISADEMDMIEWMRKGNAYDASRRVHPWWIERAKVNAESHRKHMESLK